MSAGKVRLIPRLFKNNTGKLELGIWPWTQGVKARLPLHYKQRYIETYMKEPRPVHYRPDERKYRITEHGQKWPVQNIPIPLTFPPEADLGLWGGEGFIEGYKKKKDKKLKPAIPRLWKPRLFKRALYSDILDRWMEITVTQRTLDLIDEAYGFDFYILKTHQVDLRSKLGMRLKKEMLMTLLKKSMYPDNPSKQQEIYDRYKEFIIPEEEVEWLGLSITQAVHKQATLEHEQATENITPHKQVYMDQLIHKMRTNTLEDAPKDKDEFSFSKLNPFK